MLFQSFIKIYFAFLFASLIFVTTGFSQSTSYLDSLDGKFALQFQISSQFRLTDFQGTTFSGKYQFSSRDAVRLGLSLSFSDSDGETSSNTIDTVNVNTTKVDQSSSGITVNTQYIRYIKGTDDISFFVGGGPFFTSSTSTSDGDVIRKESIEKYKETRNFYRFGIDLLLGVEWWFHKYMSLSAEYGMKLMHHSGESKTELGVIKWEISENYLRIAANSINFGITVYF